MKLKKSFFGNRFAKVLAPTGKTRKSSKVSTMEMESLESRILLSGVGTGLNKKSVTFFDADGDKVQVTISGRGATFDIDLGGATNNADIANITINGNGNLGVVVTPVGSFTRPVQTRWIYNPNFGLPVFNNTGQEIDLTNIDTNQKIQTQYYNLTPGFTNIGSITVKAGVTAIGSIGLNAAVVGDINLGTATANNINLSTGKVALVDNVMDLASTYGGPSWSPGLSKIDFFDIEAGKINGINLSGHVTGVNDFLGDITVLNGIARITGTNSDFFGQILLEGKAATLGNIVIDSWGNGASISAAGDLTFNAAGFSGVLDVDGHLNLSIRSNNINSSDVFTGTIIADGGISGLRSSQTDAILITGTDIQGQILSKGAISDIVFTNSDVTNAAFVGNSIGNITIGNNGGGVTIASSTFEATTTLGTVTSYVGGLGFGNTFVADDLTGLVIRNGNLDNSNVISVAGTLGLIDISNGNLSANIDAGDITSIILRGNGDLSGRIAAGTIGTVDIFNGSLTGTLLSQVGGIGSVDITFGNLDGTIKSETTIGSVLVDGGQITGVASIIANTSIGTVEANWLDGNITGDGIAAEAVISAGTDIVSVTGTSVFGDGINEAFISANGKIGSITGHSFFGGDGFDTTHILAGTITSITGTSLTANGINLATIVSTTGAIGSITGTGFANGITDTKVNAATALTSVSGSATLNSGIHNSIFLAASVGSVVGTSSFGVGIDPVEITASAGDVGSVTGTGAAGGILGLAVTASGSVGSISGTATGIGQFGLAVSGSGVEDAHIVAGTSVGSVTGTSFSADFADAGLLNVFVSAETTIGAISGTGTGASGILGGQYVSQGGDILSVTGSSTDANGAGDGINGANFISMLGFVNDITGSASGTGTGLANALITAQTDIGDVTGTSLFGTGIGGTSVIYSATGNIGNILGESLNATANGDGINGLTVTSALGSIASVTGTAAGFHAGDNGLENVTVNSTNPLGAPLAIVGSANAGTGISGGTYTLANGDLNVTGSTVSGTAIGGGATFIAALGKVNITVNATGAGASGIDGASFTGLSISDITVNLPSSQAGDAIVDSNFLATGGSIGKITVNNASTVGGDGIVLSSFTAAAGDIGAISVTLANPGAGVGIGDSSFTATGDITSVTVSGSGDGIIGGVIVPTSFTADSDGNGLGSISAISVTATGPNASAILGFAPGDVAFSGAAIGPIEAKTTGSKAQFGILNANFTATTGNIGDIDALTNGTGGFDAINNGIFAANGSIGDITAFAKSGTAINATNATSFTATTGKIGNIDAEGGAGGITNGVVFTAKTSIGTIDSDVTSVTGGSAINAIITAGTTIGAITVNSIATGADTVTGPIIAGTGIGAITINSAAGAGFNALNANIDADKANSWTLQAAKPVDYGALGSITVTNSGSGNGITGNISAAEVGNISVNLTGVNADKGITGLTVTASTFTETVLGSNNFNNFGKIGTITVVNQNTAGAGAGIVNSNFFAGAAGSTFGGNAIGDISVTIPNADIGAAAGIDSVFFFATSTAANDTLFNSTIGKTDVVHTGGGTGINNSVYLAEDGVGAITVTAQGPGISTLQVQADVDNDKIGNAGAITATITGAGSTGIANSFVTGFDIGNITVNFTTDQGNEGISGLFAAAAHDIGNITVGKVGAGFGTFGGLGDGITSFSIFSAVNNIGSVFASTNGNATNALDFSTGGGIFAGGNLDSITANVTSLNGGDAIFGVNKATVSIGVGGNLTNGLSITNASTNAAADGLAFIKLDVTGAVGPVSIAVAGGVAMNNASIDPTSITSLNLSGATGGLVNSEIITTAPGNIGNVTINGGTGPAIDATSVLSAAGTFTGTFDITGDVNGTVSAGSVGNLTLTGDLNGDSVFGSITGILHVTNNINGKIDVINDVSGTIDADNNINGAITIGGNLTGLINADNDIVGNISITGNDSGDITAASDVFGDVTVFGNFLPGASIEANGVGAVVGDISGFGTGNQTLFIDGAQLGNIEFLSTADNTVVNLSFDNGVTDMGDLFVYNNSGNALTDLNVTGDLTTLTDLGSTYGVYVDGQFTGGATFGSVGSILWINNAANNAGTISINDGANNVTFNINDTVLAYTGQVFIDGSDRTATIPETYQGVTINLI